MGSVQGTLAEFVYAWSNFVHQLFDKPGFSLVVAVWLGIAAVLVPNNRPAREFGIFLFVIAAVFAISWISLPTGLHGHFYMYSQGQFQIAVPQDLSHSQQTANGTLFTGDDPRRSLLLQSGEASGESKKLLQQRYEQLSLRAGKEHVFQPKATRTPYIFPPLSHNWGNDPDFFVASWDDKNGIDHYVVNAALQNGDSVRWASFELLNPLDRPPSTCKRSTAYMLDTFLVSAGVKFVARDPQCQNALTLG